MITERAVIWMFLYRHYLNGVITVGCYTREHKVTELCVAPYPLLLLSHAYMAFIYKQRACIRAEASHFPFIWSRRPHLRGKQMSVLILHDTCRISRYTFSASSFPGDYHLIEITVMYIVRLEFQFPHAIFLWLEGIFLHHLPSRKIANQSYCCGVRSPFTEHPSVSSTVNTEIVVGIGESVQFAIRPAKLDLLIYSIIVTPDDSSGIRLKPRVILEDVESLFFHIDDYKT